MSVQSPDLTTDEWNERLYNLRLTPLYPFCFIFSGLLHLGTSGDGGAFNYFQQVWTPTNFSGLAAVEVVQDYLNQGAIPSPVLVLLSYGAIPTLADSSLSPADAGNVIWEKWLSAPSAGPALYGHKRNFENFYPGVYPVSAKQPLYINVCSPGVNSSSDIVNVSVILHTIPTGLQL